MLSVSRNFKQMAYSKIKDSFSAWVTIDGVEYKGSEKFVQWNIIDELNFASTSVSAASITLIDEVSLQNKEIYLYLGYHLNGTFETIEYGPYKMQEVTFDVKSNQTTALCYDLMYELHIPFNVEGLEYPTTIKSVIEHFCSRMGITANLTGLTHVLENDLYTGTGHEYRSFLEDVAEFENNVFYFRNGVLVNEAIRETDIYLDKKRMREYQIFPEFGPVDSLVLSRHPTEDNVYASDRPDDVKFEVKFNDNYIVDYDRESHVDSLFLKYKDLVVSPFEIRTVGLGFVELGDQINVQIAEEIKSLVVYGRTIAASDSIQETLFTNDPKKTTTKYEYSTDSERRQTQTEIIVDKQTGQILNIVNNIETLGEEVSEQGSQVSQTKDAIVQEVIDRELMGDDIKNQTSTLFEQIKDEFLFEFTKIINQIENLEDDNQQQFLEIIKYIRFVDGNIILGQEGNELVLRISNDRIQFLQGNNKLAYFSDNKLYVTDAEFINSLQLGKFAFYPQSNGNLSLNKVVK